MNGGVGNRWILKSARIQPLEIRWETVIAFPLVTLYLVGHKQPSKGVESIVRKDTPICRTQKIDKRKRTSRIEIIGERASRIDCRHRAKQWVRRRGRPPGRQIAWGLYA